MTSEKKVLTPRLYEDTKFPNIEAISNNPIFDSSSSDLQLPELSPIRILGTSMLTRSITNASAKKRGRSPLKRKAFDKPGYYINYDRITRDQEKFYKEFFDMLDYERKGVADPNEIISVLKTFSNNK